MAASSGRVLVTGMGLETCVGRDVGTFWQAIAAGRSGIKPISSFDTTDRPYHLAGEVAFDPNEVMTRTEVRRTERPSQMLFSAAIRSLEDAGSPSLDRAAIVVGTGGGGIPTFADLVDRNGVRSTSSDPFITTKILPNMPAAYVAQRLGITGLVQTVAGACAASTDALGVALDVLRSGRADLVLAGGFETWISRPILDAFAKLKVLSLRSASEPNLASRPFDAKRDGMVPAEGAAVLVLERETSARAGLRRCYGTLVGAASTCDGHHSVQPRADGMVAAEVLRRALLDSGLTQDDIGLISAHGTATKLNDVAETRAFRRAFGERAYRIPITAPKSVIGHASGACGAIEAAAAILALKYKVSPPTINLVNPDPECDLDYTPLTGRPTDARYAISCNFGFGGQNSAVVLGRYDD